MPKPKIKPDIVKDKIKQKWTDQKIGDLFGISRQAIYQFRYKHGIPKVKSRHDKRNQRIYDMCKSGLFLYEIAKKFRLSRSTIHRELKKVQLKLERNKE